MPPEQILGLLVPITFIAFLFAEMLWPARQFLPRKGWRVLGLVFLLIIFTLAA